MTRSQKQLFREGEGDAWFQRNAHALDTLGSTGTDPVLSCLRHAGQRPQAVLEIGCANGYRLEAIRAEYSADCFGVDPSSSAVADAIERFPDIDVQVGTADDLPFANSKFDTLIFGFCLYLCDREDLFKIIYHADRVLKDGGLVIIYDFYSPHSSYSNQYAHLPNVRSYKMDYSLLFVSNPAYQRVYQRVAMGEAGVGRDAQTAVIALRKDLMNAYAERAD